VWKERHPSRQLSDPHITSLNLLACYHHFSIIVLHLLDLSYTPLIYMLLAPIHVFWKRLDPDAWKNLDLI
jgi:hypothetical protein